MIDPAVFVRLQENIDDDARVREELRNILQKLEQQGNLLDKKSRCRVADGCTSQDLSFAARSCTLNSGS